MSIFFYNSEGAFNLHIFFIIIDMTIIGEKRIFIYAVEMKMEKN